ncbi:MAG: SIS domain-containing protein [Actinomycetota bacterium]
MIDSLDDVGAFASIDASNMLGSVESWPDQWNDGLSIASSLPSITGEFSNAIICGMGGSGIAGDVVRSMAGSNVPLETLRGTSLPAFVDGGTLVVCVSYSGNTAETLSCFEEAIAQGCSVVSICSGGLLAERTKKAGATLCDWLPKGLMPRAALALLAVPLLVALENAGIVDAKEALDEGRVSAASAVSRWSVDVPTNDNEAKQLAIRINDKLPIIWGSEKMHVAALRMKCQLAENAKLPATVSMFPELCHNDIVGVHHGHPAIEGSILIALESTGEANHVFDSAIEIARPAVGSVEVVRRSNLIEALVFADFVSVYTGVLRGIDPTPIEAIRKLKESLH